MGCKKVIVLTGKRGGYGAMRGMLKLIEADPGFDLCLVATDMHLRYEFGHTVDEIHKDFPNVNSITLPDTGRSKGDRTYALGMLHCDLSTHMEVVKPDCLILFGDRGESLVAATAALHMNIPIAHIQGGDRTGNIDDCIRFAISSMARWHFVSCEDSADRLILNTSGQYGSEVHVVGDLHIDAIRKMKPQKEHIWDKNTIVVIYHPETGPGAFDPGKGMKEIVDAVYPPEGKRLTFIYPCSDPGYKDIVRVLESIPPREDVSVIKNMEQDYFYNLLSRAEVIVGNSSCGIIEAPYFNLPAVNVGNRQNGRLDCGNVIPVPTTSYAILKGIGRALSRDKFPEKFEKYYGDGHAGEKIVDILRKVL